MHALAPIAMLALVIAVGLVLRWRTTRHMFRPDGSQAGYLARGALAAGFCLFLLSIALVDSAWGTWVLYSAVVLIAAVSFFAGATSRLPGAAAPAQKRRPRKRRARSARSAG